MYVMDTAQVDLSTLIIDGENARREILMCIHEAKKRIRIRMYMWRDDSAGNMILRALQNKIRVYPNIQIFIEKDAFGSRVYNVQNIITFGKRGGDIFSSKAGRVFLQNTKNIHFSYIGSWWPLRLKYLRENDHSKVFLFDEYTEKSQALMGGMNIADPYLNSREKTSFYSGGWHDYMVKLGGDLADRLAHDYIRKPGKWLLWKIQSGGEILMTIKNQFAMRKYILRELSQAKKSIAIEHGYLTDALVIRRLRRLSRKGIQVNVILPNTSDGVWHANMHSIHKLLKPSIIHTSWENTIRVFIYPWMVHAKVILIDESVAIIGSANLTYGSFDFLHETNAIFRGNDAVISSLSVQIQKDISISRQVEFTTIPSYFRWLAWIQSIFI